MQNNWKLGVVKNWFLDFRTTGEGRWATFGQNNHKDNRNDYHGEGVSPIMSLFLTDNTGRLPSSKKNFIDKKKDYVKYEVSKPTEYKPMVIKR